MSKPKNLKLKTLKMPWLKKPQKQYKKSIPDEDRNEIYRSSKWKKLR